MFGTAVTSPQQALLEVVGRRPGASQSEVAAEIGLDLNTCSGLVARTVAKGLLLRERSPTDGRSFALYLTPEGREVSEAGIERASEYQDSVARRLTRQERETLTRLLRKLLGFD